MYNKSGEHVHYRVSPLLKYECNKKNEPINSKAVTE